MNPGHEIRRERQKQNRRASPTALGNRLNKSDQEQQIYQADSHKVERRMLNGIR